jgi:hypothetical protein
MPIQQATMSSIANVRPKIRWPIAVSRNSSKPGSEIS